MRRVFLFLFVVAAQFCAATTSFAQGVVFLDNVPLDSVLRLAREQQKHVLVDCYTSWCGPCKQMVREVFPQPALGDFINPRFVCVKIDMEHGEGPQLGKQYHVIGYPTFLFFDADGTLLHQSLGGCSADDFIDRAQRALSGISLETLRQQYQKGKRDEPFLINYIRELYEHNERDESMSLALQLLEGKTAELLTDAPLFRIFLTFDRQFSSPRFDYVMTHRQQFAGQYGEEQLRQKADNVLNMASGSFFQLDTLSRKWQVDEAAIDRFAAKMAEYGIEDRRQREHNVRLLAAEYQQQWDKYARLCDAYYQEESPSDGMLYFTASRIRQYLGKNTRPLVRRWLKDRIKVLQSAGDQEWLPRYRQLLKEF